MLGEAQWLASQGVTELVLVSENSTSYGKDLGDLRSLEKLLPQLAAVEGIVRVRVAYLQPAELRPGLLEVIAGTDRVAPVLRPVLPALVAHLLRRMRRFGGTDDFLALIERARALAPTAGFRTNVILGFPGETEDDVAELERFLTEGRLDAVGVFGYSDEEGTEAIGLSGKLDQAEIDARVRRITDLVEELTAQRAEDRIGERVEVLLTEDLSADEGPGVWLGHAAHQDPDSDGTTTVRRGRRPTPCPVELVGADVVDTEGIDLVARALVPAWLRPVGDRRDRRRPGPGCHTAVVGEAGQPAERADGAPAGRRPGVRRAAPAGRRAGRRRPLLGERWSSRWRSSPTATTG